MKQFSKKQFICFLYIILILLFTCILTIHSLCITNNNNLEELLIENHNQEINVNESEKIVENILEKNETIPKEENSIIENLITENGEPYGIIGNLEIPSLDINYPILSKYTEELLKISPTKYWGPNPNEVGNMVVLGHNYKTTKFFSQLPNIEIGDIIKITDLKNKTFNYSVYKTDIIDPYDNSPTSQLTNGNIEITLITCYNNDEARFVAKAKTTTNN